MKAIFLCGFMGCGKSTVGELVARQLKLPLIDTDAYLVEQDAAFRRSSHRTASRISGRSRQRRSGRSAAHRRSSPAAAVPC